MRIAVLGCGSIGRRHLRNLQSLGYADLLAYDPDAQARSLAEEETGTPSLSSLEEVWSRNPEVALITASTEAHVGLALAGARRGCHLFIEKPLSHTIDSRLKELLTEVERRNLITMIACNMRFHPGPLTIKEYLEGGFIGDILASRIQIGSYLPHWQPDHDYRQRYCASPEWGGAILDCIHEIDLALWYFGPGQLSGSAYLTAESIGLKTDGLAEILISHKSGVLSSLHVNFVQRDYKRSCQIIGSRGTLYWDWNEGQVKAFGVAGTLSKCIREPKGWQLNQMYLDELEHFLDAAKNHSVTMNPISGGLEALEIALSVKKGERKTPL